MICDLSDLPVEQCACRIHGPKDEPKLLGFLAKYSGVCGGCGHRYHPGDRIADIGGSYGHLDCL